MIALTIIAAITLIAVMLTTWAVDMRLDAIRADLDRIENMLLRIADAVGIGDELEDDWPTLDAVDEQDSPEYVAKVEGLLRNWQEADDRDRKVEP